MGVREILWLAIALLAVYVAVQLYRVLKMGAAEPAKPPAPTKAAGRAGRSARAGAAAHAEADEAAAASSAFAPVADQTSGDGFQLELETQQLRRDVAQLRAELGEQRKEIAELAARLRSHQEQVETGAGLKRASPEYDEALVFARRGLDVETIAARCGITVAEAALVRALAQRDAGDAGERR
ncbi:MAG: DUF2802 domain-containing protein [Aromatoleum sp.]|jgi:hypothetical protein|uniref:DUF2802 domain-containing protein n=1 Tax=Aromatoleum sp. TaxID=2307007 RepID=UPI00289450A2|nr:DUF2802 domain-containing protein [Aromatoleum sp.]MDT3672298.1 DUF2802 domain-containing protein [Aromatoleum sp.]